MLKAYGIGLESLKIGEHHVYILDLMYTFGKEKYAHLSDKELEKFFAANIIALRKRYPIASSILTYKGNLRISWSFDIEYNKNIDLIFFPEENPYINYAVLFAKDFPKTIDKDASIDRELNEITIPYNINYDFVREILSQSNLSIMQQERFFESRFGSVFVPMEITFEWYSYYKDNLEKEFSFLDFDPNLIFNEWNDFSNILCLGIIQSYQVLSQDISLNFPASIGWNSDSPEGSFSYTELFTPLPLAALATTRTNVNDYLVNVRDKPNAKEGKIITQLLTDSIKIPENLYLNDGYTYHINPLYQEMVDKGDTWYREDTGSTFDREAYSANALRYYHYKTKQLYFKKEKDKLINPLNFNEYLILIWNIESNNWAKVWVLRMISDEDWYLSYNEKKRYFKEAKEKIFSFWGDVGNNALFVFLNRNYSQTFLESPSTLKLYEGYIHCSGLQYLAPFSENYIKR